MAAAVAAVDRSIAFGEDATLGVEVVEAVEVPEDAMVHQRQAVKVGEQVLQFSLSVHLHSSTKI